MLDRVRSHTQKLKDAVRVCALAAFFFLILCWPLPMLAQDSFPCSSQKVMVGHFLKNGYAFAATFISDQHMVFQLFVSPKLGYWAIIAIDEKQNACLIAKGYDWAAAFERGG